MSVTFDTIPPGLAVFSDANCLIYEATADPAYGPACQRLLERIENPVISPWTETRG